MIVIRVHQKKGRREIIGKGRRKLGMNFGPPRQDLKMIYAHMWSIDVNWMGLILKVRIWVVYLIPCFLQSPSVCTVGVGCIVIRVFFTFFRSKRNLGRGMEKESSSIIHSTIGLSWGVVQWIDMSFGLRLVWQFPQSAVPCTWEYGLWLYDECVKEHQGFCIGLGV